MIKLNWGLSNGEETQKMSQTNSFNECGRKHDQRPITVQTIDKTMIKPEGVVINLSLEMEQ